MSGYIWSLDSCRFSSLLLTTTLIICSSFRTKSTFFCVVSEARTALWLLHASLALSYESLAVMNFRHELPTRCQLSPHTFSGRHKETGEESVLTQSSYSTDREIFGTDEVFLNFKML